MNDSLRRSWIGPAVLMGIGYALVGIVLALPTSHVKAWRLAAWAVSAAAYAAHVVYERFRLHNSPVLAGLHIALAVAIAAFGLAVRANVHSWSTGSIDQHPPLLLLSLVIWPVMIALPAFLVALGCSVVLERVDRRGRS